MAGKLYEMKFLLNAQANSGFKGTFSQAQAEFARLGNEIQSLNNIQKDISSYQKQVAAIEKTKAKLAELESEHAEVEQAIKDNGKETDALAKKKADLDEKLRKVNTRLEDQQARLSTTAGRLEAAKVGTIGLSAESKRLSERVAELSKQQAQAAQSVESYKARAVDAFSAAGEALAAAGLITGIKQLGEAYISTVQAAGEFEATMSNVEALSGANAQEMAALTAQAKELGATTKFTANESGEAMDYMGMAGWNARQMLAGMPGVLDLAAASGEDLAGVADIVTDSLTGFGMTANETGRFVDVLAAASAKSNTNVSMLGESFKYVAPLAGTLGYTAEDTAVMLGLMANAGIKASQAGTTLRTALTNLVSPTKEQAAEMERLHIRLTDASGQMLPLLGAMDNMRGAFAGMSEAEQSATASALFGKEAMSGMLAILNASEADYQSLTQSIHNSAGAAERMANIKLDNLAGDLTLLNSAADGLSLTIGEEFMPQVRGLVQAGTGIIGFLDTLIQDQPVLAKMIMGTAGAVGAVTAAVVAFSAAKKAAAVIDLAAMFATAGPILGVAAAVGAVTAGVIGWVEAANEGVPKVEELTEAAREAAGAMEAVSVDFDQSRVNIAATADVAGMYIDRLDRLGAKTSLTSAESAEYHNILQLLTETVPELAGSIDLATDSIEGGTEALRAQTEAWQKNAKAQAYQEAYKNLMSEHSAVMVEAAENSLRLTEAEMELNRNLEERDRLLKEIDAIYASGSWQSSQEESDYYDGLGRQVNDLDEKIRTGKKTVESYREAVDKSSSAAEEAKAAAEGYAQAMGQLTGDSQEAAGAVNDITASVLGMTDSLVNAATVGILEAGAAMTTSIGALTQEYSEAYQSAYDSISGQMGLFEAMKVEVETSVGDMISSLESQAAYMANYSENLRAAAEVGLSEGLIAQLSDGSTESAAYLQEIVANGQGKIDELNAAFAKVQEGKAEFSTTVAQMQTDLQSTMNEAAQTVDSTVQEMDMYREAAQSARSTMQGFIDGANGMANSVQAAYRSVAAGAMAAISGAMGAGLSVTRGYATGTESAAPGFALVGERGPELVFFGGGEQVVNARETAAMQRQTAVSAMPMSSGGGPVAVQIYFQFEGNATPEAVDKLREYGDEFEARVRQVMEDYALDSARRRY